MCLRLNMCEVIRFHIDCVQWNVSGKECVYMQKFCMSNGLFLRSMGDRWRERENKGEDGGENVEGRSKDALRSRRVSISALE